MSNTIFTSSRLRVRRLTLADFEDFYVMQSNIKVMQYIKPALNRLESKAELLKFINYYSDTEVFYNIWAVENSSKNQFVGILGVYKNQLSEYEIAYRLTEKAWGNAYGSEMASSLIQYALSTLKLPRLVAYVYTENIPSVKYWTN